MSPYVVMVRNGESICLKDGRDENDWHTGHYVSNGWDLVLSHCQSRVEGWAYAAVNHNAFPRDYDDSYKPCLISQPTTLYRSVSLEEMSHIMETGSVKGGGNGFNEFDGRPWVFFSPALTESTINQGEENERLATRILRSHPIEAEFTKAEKALSDHIAGLEARVRIKLMQVNEWRREEDAPLIEVDWEDFRNPNSNAFRTGIDLLPRCTQEYSKVFDLEDTIKDIQDRYIDLHKEKTAEIAREKETLTYTSAVIETVPITLGYHYSKDFGHSGMGEEDEFGLFPCQVKEEDIVRVHWVKDGVVLCTTDMKEARAVMEQVDRERAAMYGIAPAMA